jgi:hypothetical protein
MFEVVLQKTELSVTNPLTPFPSFSLSKDIRSSLHILMIKYAALRRRAINKGLPITSLVAPDITLLTALSLIGPVLQSITCYAISNPPIIYRCCILCLRTMHIKPRYRYLMLRQEIDFNHIHTYTYTHIYIHICTIGCCEICIWPQIITLLRGFRVNRRKNPFYDQTPFGPTTN